MGHGFAPLKLIVILFRSFILLIGQYDQKHMTLFILDIATLWIFPQRFYQNFAESY